jgi:hypothetical protein
MRTCQCTGGRVGNSVAIERSPSSFVEECSGLKRGLVAGTGPVDALIRKAQAIAATRQTSVSTRKKNSGVVVAGGYGVAGSYSRGTVLESGDSPPRGILSDFFDSKGEPKIEDQVRNRSPRPFVSCRNFVPSYPKIGDKNIGTASPGSPYRERSRTRIGRLWQRTGAWLVRCRSERWKFTVVPVSCI